MADDPAMMHIAQLEDAWAVLNTLCSIEVHRQNSVQVQ